MKCTICGAAKGIINHHTCYENDNTVPLCRSCHKKVHSKLDHTLHPIDEKEFKHLGIRIPTGLMEELDGHIERETHVSKSDLVRDALGRYFDEADTNG